MGEGGSEQHAPGGSRQGGEIEIGYLPRSLVSCPLPVRRPAPSIRELVRSRDRVEARIVAASGAELPHGQDRLIQVLLCTLAIEQESRRVRLGSASWLLRQLGQPPSGRNYQRLARRLERVLGCSVYVKKDVRRSAGPASVQRSYLFHQSPRLWFRGEADAVPYRFENEVSLSEGYLAELRQRPVILDMFVLRALADCPANLDFHAWASMRTQGMQLGQFAQVPLFGRRSLAWQLGREPVDCRDMRKNVRRWLGRLSEVGAMTPALLPPDADHLVLWGRPRRLESRVARFLRTGLPTRGEG